MNDWKAQDPPSMEISARISFGVLSKTVPWFVFLQAARIFLGPRFFISLAPILYSGSKKCRAQQRRLGFPANKGRVFCLQVELVVPVDIAPLMIGCLVRAPAADGRGIREQRFTLPVGCTSGDPAPLGKSVLWPS